MDTGLILNVQKYSIHDGPGIRTTVFLKGCPLNCPWCHNPESQAPGAEISWTASRCIRCGLCQEVCPHPIVPRPARAVEDDDRQKPEPRAQIDRQRCIRCGQCVEVCPTGAKELVGRQRTVAEVLDDVLRDRMFYDESGGGVTLSGGEPLVQADFCRQLLAACRREGLHTAVDTCGYGRREDLLSLAAWTDLFLYDVKILDDDRHRQYTGVSNVAILDNLTALSEAGAQIWVRVPVIPGFNDGLRDVKQTAAWVASLVGVRQLHLLPFHAWGIDKGRRVGLARPAPVVGPPSQEHLETLAEAARGYGLTVYIGG